MFQNKLDIKVTDGVYACENDNSVQSRGYVFLLGFKDHDRNSYADENELILRNPKTKGLLIYEHNENDSIEQIKVDFIQQTNQFIKGNDFEELIVLGVSAGGTIASYSVNEIDFSGPAELHTIAAPLSGYGMVGFKSNFIGDRTKFERELAMGFEKYDKPGANFKVYHHKEITTADQEDSLLSWCDELIRFCDILAIQYNNIEGSKEFYYHGYNHKTIMNKVLKMIIDCHE
jgi:hypothetical protein